MNGELEQKDGRWQLRFARRLPHPPEKVWRAMTEPEHLAAWFPTTIEGERAAGAKLHFVFPDDIATAVDGEMLVYDPPRVLEFSWAGEAWGGAEILRFELLPDGPGTLLIFVDTFDEVGKAARDGAGWHVCLDVLAEHLDGKEGRPETSERWKKVHAGYVERFGPAASTIGPPASMPEYQ